MALPAQATTPSGTGPLPTNPFPLGITKPAAAGTAVKLTHNFTDLDNRVANYLTITAPVANTGDVYVIGVVGLPPWNLPGGGTSSGADTTNYLNVNFIVPPGVTLSVPSWMLGMLRLGQFWIDVTALGQNHDFVIATFGEA